MNLAQVNSYLGSGNRCSHRPLFPVWFVPPKVHKKRYEAICWAQNNIKQFYIEPSKWLKSLRYTRESSRQQRSEARERDGKVIQVLLHHCDLASLRVGKPNPDGTFDSLSIKDIALRAGWRTLEDNESELQKEQDKGIKRVWRALDSLKKAGYITIHECIEKVPVDGQEEEQYRSLPAVKCINPTLFWELGITKQKLSADRKLASKRRQKERQEYLSKFNQALDLPKGLANNLKPDYIKNNSYNRREYYQNKRIEAAKRKLEAQFKQMNPELYALHERYPHISLSELEKMLKPPPENKTH